MIVIQGSTGCGVCIWLNSLSHTKVVATERNFPPEALVSIWFNGVNVLFDFVTHLACGSVSEPWATELHRHRPDRDHTFVERERTGWSLKHGGTRQERTPLMA